MYYAIFDNDTGMYLHTGKNLTDKRDVLESYLNYREPDFGEWWEQDCFDTVTPKTCKEIAMRSDEEFDRDYWLLWELYVSELPDDAIVDDMQACNFELQEDVKPFR